MTWTGFKFVLFMAATHIAPEIKLQINVLIYLQFI
jgi:hypothetical protein